jgi:hypothetical protein
MGKKDENIVCVAGGHAGDIVGGTCMMCGEYDPNATGYEDTLLCSGCVDGERQVDDEIFAEQLAAEKQNRKRRR